MTATPFARAEEITRDAALIETMPIQTVTLAMTAEEAFNQLYSSGYRAGAFETFSDWTEGGIELVRGDYASPDGESRITFSRTREGRIVNISETFNRPKKQFDTQAEIAAVRAHFNIAPDDPKCFVNDHGSGTCRVQDAPAAEDVNNVFGISVFPTMIIRYATRNKELKDSF